MARDCTLAKPPRRKQSDRTAGTKARLIAATLELTLNEGLAGFSVGDIAHSADCSRGLLRHHFVSKEALVMEAVRSALSWPPPTFGGGVPSLLQWLEQSLSPRGGTAFRLCATILSDPRAAALTDVAHDYLAQLTQTLVGDLRRARNRSEVPTEVDPKREAAWLIRELVGHWVLAGSAARTPQEAGGSAVIVDPAGLVDLVRGRWKPTSPPTRPTRPLATPRKRASATARPPAAQKDLFE